MLGLAVHDGIVYYQTTSALRQTLADLDRADPGWRLADIEAARAVIPEKDNGAVCVRQSAALLPTRWPPQDFDLAQDKFDPPARLEPDTYARLCRELNAVQPALAEARKLVGRPNGRHRIAYRRNPLETQLNDQQQARRVTDLLLWDALRCDEAGDAEGAVRVCRAALNAGRSIGDEPTVISQLVRIACVIKACRVVERSLAQSELRPEDLEVLQGAYADEAQFPDLLIGIRGDRALMHELYDALESGDVYLSALGEGSHGPSWGERFLGWRYRNLIRADHPTYLAFITRYLGVIQLPPGAQEAAEEALVAEVRQLPVASFPSRALVTAEAKLGGASRRKQAYLRSVVAALAAERYRQANGAWPASLDALVPAFLEAVPVDPFGGAPLRYRRLANGVVIQSVNADCTDGGALPRDNSPLQGADLGCRLWDVKHRRQPPRPVPVAPPDGKPR